MSADNWAICPQCLDRAKAEAATRFQAAVDAYGNVPAEEYERLRAEAQVPVDEESFRTFREDYEFHGATQGAITADYSGHCDVCNLGADFTYKHEFYSVTDLAVPLSVRPDETTSG
jgi:uncharacterized protein CbrC (UPF0167 family)